MAFVILSPVNCRVVSVQNEYSIVSTWIKIKRTLSNLNPYLPVASGEQVEVCP